jgi:hypothetical protein
MSRYKQDRVNNFLPAIDDVAEPRWQGIRSDSLPVVRAHAFHRQVAQRVDRPDIVGGFVRHGLDLIGLDNKHSVSTGHFGDGRSLPRPLWRLLERFPS